MSNHANVQALLKQMHDNPATTAEATSAVLLPVFEYLINVSPSDDNRYHWFCDRAERLTIEAASFLLRLLAYDSANVVAWKERFEKIVTECANCVKGFADAKLSSRTTYFGAFSDEVLANFWAGFMNWEIQIIFKSLLRLGILGQSSDSRETLMAAPSAVVYHMVSNKDILKHPQVLSLFHSKPPSQPFLDWPLDPPPPGLLILMMDGHTFVRNWAKEQSSRCQIVPIPFGNFTIPYVGVLEEICTALDRAGDTTQPAVVLSGPNDGTIPTEFPLGTSVDLWSSFQSVLRFVPSQCLLPMNSHNIDVRRVITGHLHDVGPHFPEMFGCFRILLRRLGADIWQGQDPGFVKVVFDAIKDNPAYCGLLAVSGLQGEQEPLLAWFGEYLHSAHHLLIYPELLAKVMDFMCEELQHERFRETRPFTMLAAMQLLSSVLKASQRDGMAKQSKAINNVIDIHADTFIAVAFSSLYCDAKWNDARTSARNLVSDILLGDVTDIRNAIYQLCKWLNGEKLAANAPAIHKALWTKTYESLQVTDSDAIKMVLAIVARAAHLDALTKAAFRPALTMADHSSGPAIEAVFDAVNQSLIVVRVGFLDPMAKYVNFSSSTHVLDLLSEPAVAKDVIELMLSPIDDIQVAAQSLVSQAFDVDVRLDCFRALIRNLPSAAFHGMFEFLETFMYHATVVPEACSLSKSLVRCLTDIIEVLCASRNGLLHDDRFLALSKPGPATFLPKWWTLMTKSIAVIFRRTPLWSNYFENEHMIVWMRDALIFCRELLAQRRIIEGAIVSTPGSRSSLPPVKSRWLSSEGKKMVLDLQDVLPELARWLRLTDEELLHQSFALLQTLLDIFKDSNIPPSTAGLAKLNKYVDEARKTDPARPRTRLDSARVLTLESALAYFVDDDEVQIIAPFPAKRRRRIARTVSEEKLGTMVGVKEQRQEFSKEMLAAPSLPKSIKMPSLRGKREKSIEAPSRHADQPGTLASTSSLMKPDVGNQRESIVAKNEGSSAPTTDLDSSSSDESGSEEDGAQGGLASLAELQRTPKVKKAAERRQVKMLDLPLKGRDHFQERAIRRNNAKRAALRLKPDISNLHRTVLSWKYDHQGSDPPVVGERPTLLPVPDQFSDHQHYRRVFEPLLELECWQQILQSKQDLQEIYMVKILSRQFIDDWLDVDIEISESVKKDWYLSESDVVLCSRPGSSDGNRLGKVQSYRAFPHSIQATIRFFFRDISDPGLNISTDWRLSKVFSLATVRREYAALVALPHYDLAETILRPQLSVKPAIDLTDVQRAVTRYNVNEPQAVAILSTFKSTGFSLIQGPPGTGKTSTICGLVQEFLSRRPRATFSGHAGKKATSEPPRKVLLCAPSNAAIDELANRVRGIGKGTNTPSVVRVGTEKVINISVKDIYLEQLVDQKLNSVQTPALSSGSASSEMEALRREIASVKSQKQEKQEELLHLHDNFARTMALEDDIKRLNSKRMTLTQKLDRLKDQMKSDARTMDAFRRKIQDEILRDADVICSTLSGAGHEILEQFEFEMVVIDEASQAIELSSLIPLKYGCRICVMVGDPQQLPPTVLSQEASKLRYSQSLFVRLHKYQPDAVYLLSIQYRMHPEISQLPSKLFYQGQLQNGPNMALKTKQPWQDHAKFGTYRFFNVPRGQEEPGPRQSLKNTAECAVAVALYSRLRQDFLSYSFDFKVGIVSMYSAQVQALRRAFEDRFGRDITDAVDFHTVDGFQGQEKEVIILSCVRAGPGLESIGFLADTRRMNVALTRAKSSLFILGHAPTLERSDENWRRIILDARSRALLSDVDVTYFTSVNLPPTHSIKRLKHAKNRTLPNHVVPNDLATPSALKQVVDAASRASSSKIAIEPLAQSPSAENDSGESSRNLPSKRPFSGDDAATIEAVQPAAKPRPPVKRAKPPPNLFIPKIQKGNLLSASSRVRTQLPNGRRPANEAGTSEGPAK